MIPPTQPGDQGGRPVLTDEETANANGAASVVRKPSWRQRFQNWLRLKQLESDLRYSHRFQKDCESNRCFTLAIMEEEHRQEILRKIEQMKSTRHPT